MQKNTIGACRGSVVYISLPRGPAPSSSSLVTVARAGEAIGGGALFPPSQGQGGGLSRAGTGVLEGGTMLTP
jgi:hypothetical protein